MPINITRDLKRKLFQLFPIKFVKDHFLESGNKDEVLEVVSNVADNALINFINLHHNVTKQNIYLYSLPVPFNPAWMNDFPLQIVKSDENAGHFTYIIFAQTTYSVYLSNPVEKEEIDFIQPIVIEAQGDKMMIKYTKLEKNVKSYYELDRLPKNAGESNSEADTLSSIKDHFVGQVILRKNDFNAGLKSLWADDELDCHKIRYRDIHSTVLITMDETLTFKQQYPDKYVEMIHAPIGPSVWKFLGENPEITDTFTCDPTEGTISINRYSENTNQTSHVITKLLAQN